MLLAMFMFSLSMSISPGPVNLISMNTASKHGFRFSLLFVSGATLGFILLLFVVGVTGGLLSTYIEQYASLLRYPGALYMIYLASLVIRSGEISDQSNSKKQGFMSGAMMQWLNPKAWVACLAGASGFVIGKTDLEFATFLGIYCVVCFISIALWAWAGSLLMVKLQNRTNRQAFNFLIAIMLVLSAVSLLQG
ncbi:LysE family translocator [Planctobacterium marinum]|uniref:LysE family translocator n=1 Tax=Planctobacterium marinum TaxID=1631968 RepID=UPI001E6504A6|nr:LysE family translocator [Planctobacterium marinum]MCC2605571.1 LysE family translocator [Planctobacterium marinum]